MRGDPRPSLPLAAAGPVAADTSTAALPHVTSLTSPTLSHKNLTTTTMKTDSWLSLYCHHRHCSPSPPGLANTTAALKFDTSQCRPIRNFLLSLSFLAATLPSSPLLLLPSLPFPANTARVSKFDTPHRADRFVSFPSIVRHYPTSAVPVPHLQSSSTSREHLKPH